MPFLGQEQQRASAKTHQALGMGKEPPAQLLGWTEVDGDISPSLVLSAAWATCKLNMVGLDTSELRE